MTPTRLIAALSFICVVACSGAQSGGPTLLTDTPPAETRATLVGPRCDTSGCKCRVEGGEEDEAKPPAGFKRFEVRVGPSDNALWVTVAGMNLYKTAEHATECFYLDLRPGKHAVSIRAQSPDGFGAQVKISELSAAGPWWYPTFTFTCGAPGLCDQDTLARWKQSIARFDDNLHAPCGSTKIRSVTWETGRMPDMRHPEDLQIELVLDVYKFETKHPPGAQECTKK